jgi:hypothetical protein
MLAALIFIFSSRQCAAADPLLLDGTAAHHTFDGFGGLSAGASSRLLRDYPEPQRSDILDYLYKPKHGAGLSICKIEIGGDVMSTDGTEPSHAHYRGDLNCDRGYELWLAAEALKRNPAIATFALSWGVPGWVGNGTYFSEENMLYQAQFASCFLRVVGVPLGFIGVWNERAWGGTDYVVNLRRALDAAGHASTRIVLPDNRVASDHALLAAIASNATFGSAFAVAGLHGSPAPVPLLEATGHKYWQSETGFAPVSLTQDWEGARQWAQILLRNYIVANITATVTWSTLWSVLPRLPYDGRGLMVANTPWSGNFADSAPLWVSAHLGQFTAVGWRHLLTGRGAGYLPPLSPLLSGAADAGSFAAFVPPDSLQDLTLVCETMGVAQPSQRVFALTGGLPGPGAVFEVWQTTNASRFVRLADATVAADSTLTLQLPGDGMVTASTLHGAAHGQPAAPVPPPAPLALPYADAFDAAAYAYDSLPRYLSDQGGSFAVRNGTLVQTVAQRPGKNDWFTTPDPITLLGDYAPWADVSVSVRALLPPQPPPGGPSSGDAEDPTAVVAPCHAAPAAPASPQAWGFNTPHPGYLSNTLPSLPPTCLNLYGCSPRLVYYACCAAPCGCSNAQGFFFTLQHNSTLTAPLLPGLCATVKGDGATVTMAPCASPLPPSQSWTHNASTLQLVNAAGGGCLTSTLVPLLPYVRLCARITQYSGFHGLKPVPGYCLRVDASGAWAVTAAGNGLGNGTLPGFDGTQWLTLQLTTRGTTVAASVGGVQLGVWTDKEFQDGMVALGSGVHHAAFDDFLVSP